MGAPFSVTSISGYNSNPPSDDGTQTEANRVKWSTIKTKLPDPIKTAYEASETATLAAFAKIIGGNGITSTAGSYSALSTDQGKLIYATGAGATISTPDATDVDDPFVFGVRNASAGTITIDGFGSQTIDGAANVTMQSGDGTLLFTDGTNWFTTGLFPASSLTLSGTLTAATVTATGALNGATIGGSMVATVAEMETAGVTDKVVTPFTMNRSPGVAKAFVKYDSSGSVSASHNITSVTDGGAGALTPNWATDFSSANYSCVATPSANNSGSTATSFSAQLGTSPAAGSALVYTLRFSDGAQIDVTSTSVGAFGDQA